jgi:hypothetical protein
MKIFVGIMILVMVCWIGAASTKMLKPATPDSEVAASQEKFVSVMAFVGHSYQSTVDFLNDLKMRAENLWIAHKLDEKQQPAEAVPQQ